MGFLKKAASSVAKAATRKVEETKRSVEEERSSFALQREVEESSLPFVCLLRLIDHEVRTWRGRDLDVSIVGGKCLYRGQVSYYDWNNLEKRRYEGFVTDLVGTELARVTSHRDKENFPESYALSISGMPDQRLRDVTSKMVSKAGERIRYGFMSLEPMGWVFRTDTKETALAMGHGEIPQRIWRVGYGENITARIERADSRISRAGGGIVIRCRDKVNILPLVLVAIALTGTIDHK